METELIETVKQVNMIRFLTCPHKLAHTAEVLLSHAGCCRVLSQNLSFTLVLMRGYHSRCKRFSTLKWSLTPYASY